MLRTIDLVEEKLFTIPFPAVNLAAGVAQTVLKSLKDMKLPNNGPLEIAYRIIFNAGANNVYYSFGDTPCDTVSNFNGYITPGNMISCSTADAVSVVASGGNSVVSFTVVKRDDLIQPRANIL